MTQAKRSKGANVTSLWTPWGLLLTVVVHAADAQDRDGAKLVLEKVKGELPRLRLIWADGEYAGQFVGRVKQVCGWDVEIIRRPRAEEWICAADTLLGSGADVCVVRQVSEAGQGLRGISGDERGVDLYGDGSCDGHPAGTLVVHNGILRHSPSTLQCIEILATNDLRDGLSIYARFHKHYRASTMTHWHASTPSRAETTTVCIGYLTQTSQHH